MKRLSGFSLMEMMIVLAIVSIVAAASAPMINKKLVSEASNTSLWTKYGDNIFYNNGKNQNNRTVSIGATSHPNFAQAKLFIKSDQGHLIFQSGNKDPYIFQAGGLGDNIWLTTEDLSNGVNSVAIGRKAAAYSSSSVAIGDGANTNKTGGVAIGSNSSADEGVAIGENTIAPKGAVAIGSGAQTLGEYAIIIGSRDDNDSYPHAENVNDIAIGKNAHSRLGNAIAIGPNTTAVASGRDQNTNLSLGLGECTSLALGKDVSVQKAYGIGIGSDISSVGQNAIAIGSRSKSVAQITTYETKTTINQPAATGGGSIAIGQAANAEKDDSIAIGTSARAKGDDSIAIGRSATVEIGHTGSVAIGAGATAERSNEIVLGTSETTVRIPGKLVVDGNTLLGGNSNSYVYLREGGGSHSIYSVSARFKYAGNYAMGALELPSVIFNGVEYYTVSDLRLKNIGKAFAAGLEELKKLEFFHYTFIDDKEKTPHVGVIAQDLQKVFPDAVIKGEDGFLRIRLEDMFYAAINAIKELDAKIFGHDKKLAELEKQNKLQQEQIAKLEKRLAELEKRVK